LKTRFYIIIPTVAFVLILSNALFGHLIFAASYDDGDINKYDVYVHLQPEWNSYPGNILFDVTTVWDDINSTNDDGNYDTHNLYYDPKSNPDNIDDYNYNEIRYIGDKSYVELKHEFSDCGQSWQPILYKYALDSIANKLDNLQGMELNGDPYAAKYAKIKNDRYDDSQQESKLKTGYAQFIPICTSQDMTDYDFSVKINDENVGFDVYFVDSVVQLENYLNNMEGFEHYTKESCYGVNYHSFHGSCKNIGQDSGLIISIPDELSLSLTRITVNLHENTDS
jgi:hypothetical protein